jgi:hypothetical protein
MSMNFEELDTITRQHMLDEFEAEQAGGKPYYSKGLSPAGIAAFPNLMRDAIKKGTETSLCTALTVGSYWNPTETYVRNGVARERQVNIGQAAERLAVTEFNTWYVRGPSKRLLVEGVTQCQAYRASAPKWEPGECSQHEGQVFTVEEIYRGHRARYWPSENLLGVSIPFGPGCHHTIRRA